MKDAGIGFGVAVEGIITVFLSAIFGIMWTLGISMSLEAILPGGGMAEKSIIAILATAALVLYVAKIFPWVVISIVLVLTYMETKTASLLGKLSFC